MTQSQAFAAYFETAAKASGQPKLVANWLMGEVSKRLNAEGKTIEDCPVHPELFAALISNIANGAIHKNGANVLLDDLWAGNGLEVVASGLASGSSTVAAIGIVEAAIEAKGLRQISDTGELDRIIDEVLAANPKSVEEYRAGKDKAFNALVGQAMKATKGKGNPTHVNELLKKKLG